MRTRKLVYISPGGSGLFDDHYEEVLNEAALPGTMVDVVHLSLEKEDDSPFLSPYPFYYGELFRTIKMAADEGFDAAIIGCSADPGLIEARRMVEMPVTAPLHANLHIASMLGKRVTILVPGTRQEQILYQSLARMYGLSDVVASILPIDLGYPPAEELAQLMRQSPEKAREVVLDCHREFAEGEAVNLGRQAIEENGGIIYLGCTLWTGMVAVVAEEVGRTVLDAGLGALRVAEMLADRSRKP